jgi:FMN reductase
MSDTSVETPSKIVRVASLCGSLRPGSYTAAALRIALEGAKSHGAETHAIDLRDYDLSLHCGDLKRAALDPKAQKFRADVKAVDGLVIGTPEYHGSFSGVLKNALDYLTFDEMEGKMIGLVGVSGGAMGAFGAMNGLRHIGRALHAWVVPEQAAVPEAWKVFDAEGRMRDARLEKRVAEVGQEVARFAGYHKCGRYHEFMHDWETAPENPGGEG